MIDQQYEDPRRTSAPPDHLTDEEIRDQADAEAQRADDAVQNERDLSAD